MTRFHHTPGLLLASMALMLAGCEVPVPFRSDAPVTVAAATTEIVFDFPPHAHSVYYIMHMTGLNDHEYYIRFSVPPAEVDAAAQHVIDAHTRAGGTPSPYLKLPLSDPDATIYPMDPVMTPAPWWTPAAISTGYYRGGGSTLRIWADAGGTIYLRESGPK